jgi:hypothetical protein
MFTQNEIDKIVKTGKKYDCDFHLPPFQNGLCPFFHVRKKMSLEKYSRFVAEMEEKNVICAPAENDGKNFIILLPLKVIQRCV